MARDHEANPPPTYRAFRVTPEGRITGVPTILDAKDDDEAIARAHQLVDGVGIEVWDRARRVVSLPPKGKDKGTAPT